jgi:putative transcriptional regulator
MSKILKSVHASAKRMHDAGHMDDITMREFDALCLAPTPEFTAKDVARIRAKSHASQSVFAAYLNVGKTTVAAWEQGTKKPSGAASKLLELVDRNGLDILSGKLIEMSEFLKAEIAKGGSREIAAASSGRKRR